MRKLIAFILYVFAGGFMIGVFAVVVGFFVESGKTPKAAGETLLTAAGITGFALLFYWAARRLRRHAVARKP